MKFLQISWCNTRYKTKSQTTTYRHYSVLLLIGKIHM